MAERDRRLLEAAGISITEAALLFRRSRQALYSGLANARTYFSAQDAMVLLHDAKRRDSSRLEELNNFIATNYDDAESRLILPGRIGHEQLSHVTSSADQVLLAFNGNVAHLSPGSDFAQVLKSVLGSSTREKLGLIVPSRWVVDYIKDKIGLAVPDHVGTDDSIQHLPSFVVTARDESFRAFFFGRLSLEEIPSTDAAELWTYFAPKCAESFARIIRKAG